VVEHLPQGLGALLVEDSIHALGARGAGGEGVEAALVEGADGVPHRLRSAPEAFGYLRRRLPAGARQKNLAAAHHESVFGAQPRFEPFALLSRQFPDENRRFHANYYSPSHTILSEDALDHRVDISGTLVVEEIPTSAGEAQSVYVEVDQVEPAGSPDPRITVTFELTVEGEPPASTVFVGLLGGEPVPLELTDPDGDGVYAYSKSPMPASAGEPETPARIAQGEGPLRSGPAGPYLTGPITTIKDFGLVTLDEDTTLRAAVSFEESQEGTTPETTSGPDKPGDLTDPKTGADINEDGSVDEADGEVAARVSDSAREAEVASGERTLPTTGGAVLLPIIAGLLLAVGGFILLARRAIR